MNDAVLSDLQKQLESPEGFSSYQAIVEWLQEKHGLSVKYATVYEWGHDRLGEKLKVPRPQSYQQDEQAVEALLLKALNPKSTDSGGGTISGSMERLPRSVGTISCMSTPNSTVNVFSSFWIGCPNG